MKPTTDTPIVDSRKSGSWKEYRANPTADTQLSLNWYGVSGEAKEQMKSILVEEYKPDLFLTLETFGSDKGGTTPTRDKRTARVVLFVDRLANSTKQHIRYTLFADRCPTSGKIHFHLTLTFEKYIVSKREIEKLWLCMVKGKLNKQIEKDNDRLSNKEWLEFHQQGKWKSNYACKVSTDKEVLGEQLFYGFRKHEEFREGVACPKKGSCKFRSCWLITTEKWNSVLEQRYSNK